MRTPSYLNMIVKQALREINVQTTMPNKTDPLYLVQDLHAFTGAQGTVDSRDQACVHALTQTFVIIT